MGRRFEVMRFGHVSELAQFFLPVTEARDHGVRVKSLPIFDIHAKPTCLPPVLWVLTFVLQGP